MLSKVTSYLKNVGKSVVYAVSDVIQEDAGNIYSFAETNREIFTQAYSSVKNYRTTFNKIESSFKSSKVYQAADIGIKAVFEDLRTGKFYNKAREEEIASKLGGFNLSDDFDMEAFEKGLEANANISDGDKAVVDTITKTNRQTAELISDTIARSTAATIEQQKASDRVFFTQNTQIISGIHAGVETMNLVGRTVNNTNEMLKTIADNQKKFYETAGKNINDIRALLMEMTEMQRNLYDEQRKSQQQNGAKKKIGYSDVVDSNGMPDIREYFKVVKGNANRKLNEMGLGMLINGFGEDSNMLAQFVSSPLKAIPQLLVKSIIPETTRAVTKSFNETVSGIFSNLIAKANRAAANENGSPISRLIGDLLGIKVRRKTTIDTGKYQKGPVPFDGITKKAIVEVIPGYLRRIEGLIAGKRETGFDYNSGKWVDFKAEKERYDNNADFYASMRSAISDFTSVINKYTSGIKFESAEKQDIFDGMIQAFYNYVGSNHGDWTKFTKKGKDNQYNLARTLNEYTGGYKVRTSNGSTRDLHIDTEDIAQLQALLREIKKDKDFKRASSKIANDSMLGQQRYTEKMESFEGKGDSLLLAAMADSYSNKHVDKYGAPKRGSFAGSILLTEDQYKKNVFDYLRSLDTSNQWIKDFIQNNAAKYLPRGGKKGNGYISPNSLIMPDAKDYGTATRTAEQEAAERIKNEYTKHAEQAKRYANKDNYMYISEEEPYRIGSVIEHAKALNDKFEKDREKAAQKEPSFWADIFGIDTSKKDYKSEKFLEQLREAQTIGDKYGVIKRQMEKLAEAPMKMIEHTIKKADEAVYHFMFGDADDEVDEDGNPIKGLLAKTIHEMKQTFKNLNVWLNEKLLDPLKAKLDEWGIHSLTDALDKITGGRFSDAKNAIADTILGTKGEDGRRTGGWADPFRKAFSYNWEAVMNRRSEEARKKKEKKQYEQDQLDRMNRELEDNPLYSSANGTAGRTKSDLLTMLSPGEYLIGPSGDFKTITESESYSPHLVPKGTTIYNPQPKSVRTAQKAIEQQKAINWAKNMKFNADADELGGLKRFEKYLFKNPEAKQDFIDEYNYISSNISAFTAQKMETDTSDKMSEYMIWCSIESEFWKYNELYSYIANPTGDKYDKDVILLGKFVKFVSKVYDAMVTNKKLSKELFVDEQALKLKKAKGEGTSQQQEAKPINGKLHEILDKYTYNEDSANRARVEKIADSSAKMAIGTGAGLLLGNPLLGLVGGTLAGLAKNNAAFNKFLFGDEESEGLISKKTQEFLKKSIPDVSKGSAIGAVAGLLTGMGPIPGVLMGSAVGFVKNNEEIMELLFGPKDERKDRAEKIKKALPRMGLGAAAGALLGPFGILGGAALGAGAGLLTTTTGFKEFLYGELDEEGNPKKDEKGHYTGGVVGALRTSFVDPLKEWANDLRTRSKEFIRDKIVDPIAGAIKPIAAGMKHIVKDVLNLVPDALNNIFQNVLGIPLGDFLRDKIFNPVGRFVGGIIKAPINLLKFGLSIPGKVIGGIGNAIKGSQIRRGTADYMTAEERLAFREDHKLMFSRRLHPFRKDRMLDEDKRIAAMKMEDTVGEDGKINYGVNSLIEQIEQATSTSKDADKAYRIAQRGLAGVIDEQFRDHGLISTKNNKTKILKALYDGKLDVAMNLVGKLKTKDGRTLSGQELQAFQDKIMQYYNAAEQARSLKKSVNSRKGKDNSVINQLNKTLKGKGFKNINLNNRKHRDRILALLKKEKNGIVGSNYVNAMSDKEQAMEHATNLAIEQHTSATAEILGDIRKELRMLINDPEGYRNYINSGGMTAGDAMDTFIGEKDENGNYTHSDLARDIASKTRSSMTRDMKTRNQSRAAAKKVRAGQKAKSDSKVKARLIKAKNAGLPAVAGQYWDSLDSRVDKIFDLLSKNRRFDINAALGKVFSAKNFISNLDKALNLTNGNIIDAERIERIAAIGKSKTQIECLDYCVTFKIPVFDSTKFSIDQISATLGAGAQYLKNTSIKNAFRNIRDYVKAYGSAPDASTISAWFRNSMLVKADKKTIKNQMKENGPATNAEADQGTEKRHVFRDFFDKHFEFHKDAKEAGSDIGAIVGILRDIKNNTETSAEADKKYEEERKAKKKEEKEAKKKAKAAKKASRAGDSLWSRMNAGVEDFGESVREGGNSVLEFLSHPFKMMKGAIHGTKEEFEKKRDAGGKASIIDMLRGINQGVHDQIDLLKHQENEGERKEPIWKRILKLVFGKSAVGIALKAFALPLGVGLFKNHLWPLIKNKAWPWIQEKLFGDPERDDDGLFGKLSVWFKDKVVPLLFGEKNEEGVWTKGWFSGAANFWEQKVKPFMFGEDGQGGVWGKLQKIIHNIGYIVGDSGRLIWSWLTNKRFDPTSETSDLFPGIFQTYNFDNEEEGSSGLFKLVLTNWADGAGTMVEFATKTIVKVLPDVLMGLGKGVLDGIVAWFKGKDDTKAKSAVSKTIDMAKYDKIDGGLSVDGSKKDPLVNITSKIPNITGSGATDTESSVSANQVASGGKVSGLLETSEAIYNNGQDITEDMKELNEIYSNFDGSDKELEEAIRLASNNLVILPPSMFGSKEEYQKYFDAVFGEGALEEYGYDELCRDIQEPYLVPQDSEAYKQMMERASRGERISRATLKYIFTGGGVGKALPALMRASSKVLKTVAKVASKFGFTGKAVSLTLKGAAFVTEKITNVATSAAKVSKATLSGGVAAGKVAAAAEVAEDVTEFAAKHPKLAGFISTVGEFFSGLFKSNDFCKKIAEVSGKAVKKVQTLFSNSKITKLAKGFVEGISKKCPSLLAKAGSGLLKALPFINVAFITTAFCTGFYDVQNILGINPHGEIISGGLRIVSGVVNAINEFLTAGLVPTDFIAQWFVDNILIGMFNIQDDYTEAHQAAQKRVDDYNAANDTNLSIREYNEIYHPSEWQLLEKDMKNGDIGSIWDNFIGGWKTIFSGNAGHVLGFGKGHIDQRSSNMRYNAPGDTTYQTVADSGCGPAAAATVLSQYGKGKLEDAAKYSLAHGYKEPDGGTYPGFFGDYLGQNGIATKYERDPNQIMNNLAQGKPVILMGTGSGRGTSPFDGANGSHYVTATGLDNNGNIIVEDPDSRVGGTVYSPKNVLGRTSIAISTSPGRGGLIGKSYGGSRRATLTGRSRGVRPMFGLGSNGNYSINDIDKDGLQDLKWWKDPGSGASYEAYVKAIAKRIKQAARYQTDGIYYQHADMVAEAAVKGGLKTGIDPALAIAIGMFESGFGTTPTAKNKLNFWGYNFNNKTWEAGASDFSKGTNGNLSMINYAFEQWMTRIRDNYYNNGQKCLYQMYDNGGKHQYPGDIDRNTTNWVVMVAYYMKAIHDAVGQTDANVVYHSGNGNWTYIPEASGTPTKYYQTSTGFSGVTGTDTSPDKVGADGTITYSGNIANSSSNNDDSSGDSIFSMIANYGKNVLKEIFGPVYEFLFGKTDSTTSESTSNLSGTYSGVDAKNINHAAKNATQWFLETIGKDAEGQIEPYISAPYAATGDAYFDGKVHSGIDIATHGMTGIPVRSPIDGFVYKVGHSMASQDYSVSGGTAGGYGENVLILDKDGQHLHRFGHLMRNAQVVQDGEEVTRDKIIGYLGNTGWSTGAHLHYEIDKFDNGVRGKDINPDLDYDWSKYIAVDPESGTPLSEVSDYKIAELLNKENEKFMTNYRQIGSGDAASVALNNYLKSESLVKKEARKRIDKLSGSYAASSNMSTLAALKKAVNFSLADYYADKKAADEAKFKQYNKDTPSEVTTPAETPTITESSLLDSMSMDMLYEGLERYKDLKKLLDGDTNGLFKATLEREGKPTTLEGIFEDMLKEQPKKFTFNSRDTAFNVNNDAIAFVKENIKDAEYRNALIEELEETRRGSFYPKVISEINQEVADQLENDKEELRYALAHKDEFPDIFKKEYGYGRGKGGSTSGLLSNPMFNIIKEKKQLDIMRGDNSSESSIKSKANSLINNMKTFVKKTGIDPMATDAGIPMAGKGRAVRAAIASRSKYGRATMPTLSTTKTYVAPVTTTSDAMMINYSKLIITIIELLTRISDNSDKVDRIIDLLRKYGPSLGIDTSGYGKAKTTAEKTAAARHSIVRNHVMDPSWGFAAMDHMNREDTVNNFMTAVLELAKE